MNLLNDVCNIIYIIQVHRVCHEDFTNGITFVLFIISTLFFKLIL